MTIIYLLFPLQLSLQAFGLGMSTMEISHVQVTALEQRVVELEAELAKIKNPDKTSDESINKEN